MALTGRGPCNSSTSAAGCQYIRISFPHASLRPGPGYQVVLFLAHHGGASFRGQSSQTG